MLQYSKLPFVCVASELLLATVDALKWAGGANDKDEVTGSEKKHRNFGHSIVDF